jgi:transposase InsO family protein
VTRLCDVLRLSTSGYCARLKRVPSQRARADDALSRRIGTIHEASRGTCGVPRVHADAFSRRIVGWSMATHLRTSLVLGALEMAVQQR